MADRLLLYDGVCALCNRVVRDVLKRDRAKRYLFAPLQGEPARARLRAHGLDPDALDTFVLILDPDTPHERARTRGRAGLQVLVEMGGLYALARVLVVLPTRVLDWAYDRVARHRYGTFGRFDACPVPPAEYRDRFVDG